MEYSYILTPYQSGGSLMEFALFKIKKGEKLSYDELKIIIYHMVKCLHTLHNDFKKAHGDIKLDNFIINKFLMVKLIDYGACTDISKEGSNFKGTIKYMAPEIKS